MKNKSLIFVYIIQTQIFHTLIMNIFLWILVSSFLFIYSLVFIDLKWRHFLTKSFSEVKFCSISESIFFPRTHQNYNVGICLLVGLYSYNIRFSLILAEVLLETKNHMVKFWHVWPCRAFHINWKLFVLFGKQMLFRCMFDTKIIF